MHLSLRGHNIDDKHISSVCYVTECYGMSQKTVNLLEDKSNSFTFIKSRFRSKMNSCFLICNLHTALRK